MVQQTELSELREQHEANVTELKTMADQWQEKGCNATDEEIVRYDEVDESIKGLAQSIATIERADKVKSYLANPKRSEVFGSPVIKIKRSANRHDYDNAFKAWALGGHETRQRVRDDWKRSAELIDIDYESRDWICRDQTSDVNSEGGHFDNDSLYRGFVEARKAFGGMLQASHVVNVATAETSHYATDDDTSQVAGTHLQAESVTNVSVTVGRKSVTPTIYSSGIFPVSLQLLRDSKEDIGAWVSRKLSRRILSKVNLDLTADLYTGTVEGETGFSTLTDDEDLYNLYFSVDAAYRNSPKTAWMLNDSTLAVLINRLQDTAGNPIWGNGLRESPENQILGKRIIINNDMDTGTAGVPKKPIVFGDFENMIVHTVGPAPTFRRLEELYMASLAVGFVAHWEVDGINVNSGQGPLRHLLTGTLSGDT